MSWRTLVLYLYLGASVLAMGAFHPPGDPVSPLASPLASPLMPPTPSPTSRPTPGPTSTPASEPTRAPTSTPTPWKTLRPDEAPAQSISDVVGSWRVGGEEGLLLTLWPDGSFSSGFPYFLRSYFDSGMFAVADGQLQWLTSQACAGYGQATYAVFVVKEDGRPVRLRFEPVGEDPCWLREMLLVMEPVMPGPR